MKSSQNVELQNIVRNFKFTMVQARKHIPALLVHPSESVPCRFALRYTHATNDCIEEIVLYCMSLNECHGGGYLSCRLMTKILIQFYGYERVLARKWTDCDEIEMDLLHEDACDYPSFVSDHPQFHREGLLSFMLAKTKRIAS
ncbi:hypothetical protein UB37_07320 [Photobacterium iliopiscarium]|uniref:Uncharacterized protein n=1 Tax=Photobacterium iliopiscarium TaxID=56192 RepID=A0ABX5GSL6_9GAMM|nr:hypothetical protein [Photobacterium iliopiscarium]KJG23049.1 hypothetical protein UB37_07320 [Photobacterium iliopiscarium]PSW96662.1 hypothetical protein C9J52_09560 [Photobacterium iliopiscarium]